MASTQEIFSCPEAISGLLKKKGYNLIGLDGGNGVGKTTLSITLENDFGFNVIHLDELLNKDQCAYIKEIDIDSLHREIEKRDAPLIVEGCCLLAVLKRVHIQLDAHIYYKRMCHGVWSEEDEYEIPGNLDDHIEKKKVQLKQVAAAMANQDGTEFDESEDDYLPSLTRELFKYHNEYQPHHTASYIYERNS